MFSLLNNMASLTINLALPTCFTNLLDTFEDWTTSIDQGNNVDVVFLDFKKAFDSVPHQRLLIKLGSYGITNDCLNWIGSFLCG